MRPFIANSLAIWKRELASYFLSPIAYVVIGLFLLVNGWIFHYQIEAFRQDPYQIDRVIRALFRWVPFWSMVLTPIITMRLIAEEKRSGTLESLMTAPVTAGQVVAGKFLAAETFFTLIWATLLLHVLILGVLGDPDLGPVAATYIGLVSLGALMNGLGLLASAFTRNQVIAVIVAFVANLSLALVDMLRQLFPDDPEADRFFDFAGVFNHFDNEYYRGVVDLRSIALYLAGAAVALFLATRVLWARRWR